MSRSHTEFNDTGAPLGYLITFNTYGTWLHGDRRGSVDRFHNVYGTPRLLPSSIRQQYERRLMKMPPVKLNSEQRAAVERSIHETCSKRKWTLWARNVRTKHTHVVVTAFCRSRTVLNAFKANATRTMREAGCWRNEQSPWAEGGSRKELWTEKDLTEAIVYVEYEQGEPRP